MNKNEKALRFFLGANTPQGFVSRFDQLTDSQDGWRKFVIKGGPGSGKSTLMKKVVQQFEKEGIEIIHCSSDVDSLDGVIVPSRKFCIADGTSPHVRANIIRTCLSRFDLLFRWLATIIQLNKTAAAKRFIY